MTQQPDNPETAGTKLGSIMIHISWIALLILVTFLMQGWIDKRHNPNASLEISTDNSGQRQLILQRNPYGHYVASGQINGEEAIFLLDTGATHVVIPDQLAKRYQLEYGYPIQVKTANGVITVYKTQLKQVTLGPIRLHNVSASINPKMDDDEILLGMSFLKHLALTQYQDKLILSPPSTAPAH